MTAVCGNGDTSKETLWSLGMLQSLLHSPRNICSSLGILCAPKHSFLTVSPEPRSYSTRAATLHLIFPADRRYSSSYAIQSVKSEPEVPPLCACVSSDIPDNFQGAEIWEKTVLGDCWRATSITANLLTVQLEPDLNHYYKLA